MKTILKLTILAFIFITFKLPNAFCEKASTEAPSSVVIADFNRDSLINNLYGESGTWEKNPEDKKQWITASLDGLVRRGESGSSLRIEYNVGSPGAVNGFWTQLRDFDASKYDHFEFWVKGDEKKGFTSTFKIEFNKYQKDNEGRDETIKGTYIVKGITDQWQKVSIPLNVLNGIINWQNMRELAMSFENRRVDSSEGVLYFDDFSFVRTGSPGPTRSGSAYRQTRSPVGRGSTKLTDGTIRHVAACRPICETTADCVPAAFHAAPHPHTDLPP